MPKPSKRKNESDSLKGWQQIAAFLGQSVSVVQRWAESGMPVEKRGQYVYSSREELNRWLGRESAGEPVQIATESADLSDDLRRGLSFIRSRSQRTRKRAAQWLRPPALNASWARLSDGLPSLSGMADS